MWLISMNYVIIRLWQKQNHGGSYEKKYVILMTSVLVFVIMAIVVYTMNFSFLKILLRKIAKRTVQQ